MSGPFATPTVRASNPLEEALAAESTYKPPTPFTASSPPTSPRSPHVPSTRRPSSPPAKPSMRPQASSSSSVLRERARSPPAKRAGGGRSGAAGNAPHPQAGRDPANPSRPAPPPRPRPHPQAHSQHQLEQPHPDDLAAFSALCRRLYYDRDPTAARQVDVTLAKLPPSFRTAYARTMAAVRSRFHRDEEIRRRTAVESTLASTFPGQAVKLGLQISPESTSVAAMRAAKARQLRREGLRVFIETHCVAKMPGTHPFFRSLYAALYLQGLESAKGGAGARCVEWEVDVAVFSEAGGGESWGKEAIEALKAVLGMSEVIKERSDTDSTRTSFFESTIASSRSSSLSGPAGIDQLVEAAGSEPPHPNEHGVLQHPHPSSSASTTKKPAPPVPPHRGSIRNRSKSDPFLAPEEKAAKLALSGLAEPPLRPSSPQPPSPDLNADTNTPLLSSPPPISASSPLLSPRSSPPLSSAPPPPPLRPQFRIFTLPSYLTNPESRSLCRLFPDFISTPTRPSARFRSNSASKAAAAKKAAEEALSPSQLEAGELARKESGEEAPIGGGTVGGGLGKVGHGELRIGKTERDKGWKGTGWQRFVGWFKGVFGMA